MPRAASVSLSIKRGQPGNVKAMWAEPRCSSALSGTGALRGAQPGGSCPSGRQGSPSPFCFVPGWTSCPDQRVFTQERPRSLTVCGWSPRQAGWPDTHVSQSSQRIGAVFGASGPTAGGQGAWAPWALAATSGGRGTGFLGAPLSIPATQLSTCTG